MSIIGKPACGTGIASSHQLCFTMTLGKKKKGRERERDGYSVPPVLLDTSLEQSDSVAYFLSFQPHECLFPSLFSLSPLYWKMYFYKSIIDRPPPFFCDGGNYQKISKKSAKKSLFFHIQKRILPKGRTQIDSGRASVSKSQGRDKQVFKPPAE